MRTAIALVHGGYYLLFGAWPVLHLRSFEAITGPKNDDWLVVTVGVLLAVQGSVLLVAGLRGDIPELLRVVAVGTAIALAIVDVAYVSRGTIAPVYLLDAAAESTLVIGWSATFNHGRFAEHRGFGVGRMAP